MLSFFEFINYHDFDILVEELIFDHDKNIIITFSFLNFFFKKLDNEIQCYKNDKKNKNKFIKILKECEIDYTEKTFNEIYKLKENIDINKILKDCDNKSERVIKNLKWICLKKKDLKHILNCDNYIKKFKSLSFYKENNIAKILLFYSNYLEAEDDVLLKSTNFSIL